MDLQPGKKLGEIIVERRIGCGAFGTVYLARDPLIGRQVALKVVRGEEHQREQILREARLAGKLDHPNIVTLYRVHPPRDSDAWVFEFEFVAGGTLRDLLAAGPLGPERIRELARGIAAGLEAAHRAGVVHGDVKPGNVLLTREGTPKIADFGLGRVLGDISLRMSDARGPAGTPSYMAPEVMMGESATRASDVWSLGVLLYGMACGRLPFPAPHVQGLVYAIQNREPAAPPGDTPPEVAAAIHACLAKHPDDRPQDAAGVVQILRAESPAPVPRAAPPRSLTVTRLRGRDHEVTRLRRRIESACNERQGCCVLIAGEAGIGKTALAREAARWARELDFVWVDARVSALEGVVRPLLRSVRSASDARAGDSHSMSERIGEVLESSEGLRIEESQPALATLERTLSEILAGHRLVLLIDDLHEGKPDDVGFCSDLARRLVADGAVILLCARPTGPEGPTHRLGSRRFVESLELGPLSREESYALLEDRATATVAPEVVRRIHATAAGNPRFLGELLRYLLETGAVAKREDRLEPGPEWRHFELPRRLRDLVSGRLERLPREHRELLDVAAVAGRDFDSADVAAVVGQPVLTVLRRLQETYRERGLVTPLEHGYRFSIPLIRDVIYGELAADLRRVLHRAFAERLEDRPGADPERLGAHWEGAGEPDKAAPWFRKAAMRADGPHRTIDLAARGGVSAGALEGGPVTEHRNLWLRVAGRHFDIGEHETAERIAEALLAGMEGEGEETLRLTTIVTRAQWRYRSEGEGAVDLEELEEAAHRLPPGRARIDAFNLLAVIHKFHGDLDASEAALERTMAALDEFPDDGLRSSAVDQQASIALRRGRLEEAEGLYAEAARLSEVAGRRRYAATSEVNRILVAFQRGALEGLEADLKRSIRVLELEDVSYLAAHARIILAAVQYAEGHREVAQRELERAMTLLRERGYWLGLGHGLVQLGGLQAVAGDYDEALETLREAEELGRRHDYPNPINGALAWRAKCLVARGAHEEAVAAARACHDLLRETNDAAIRREVVFLLAEAVFMGLPLDAFPAEDLAPDATTRALARAAHEWQAGSGTEALRAAAAALRDPAVADRRAERRILADLLESEALRREGEAARATEPASRALLRAQRLGHAWYVQALEERSG